MNLNHQFDEKAKGEVIHLGAGGSATRWGLYLVIFMRVLAALWLAQGLIYWRMILSPEGATLDSLPALEAATIVFFAVIDLVAAVGLWLAVPWGGVLWLFAIAAQMFLIGFMPGIIEGGRLMLALDVSLVVGYFVLSWYAAQERDAV